MMSVEDLLVELQKLNRADKLRAMQLLVMELSSEEDASLVPGAHYEVWSPFDAPSAAESLTRMLEADKAAMAAPDA
ncbi:MAG: hypothetical protein ACRDI2_09480 [Chloroflexota bacterium]